MTDASNSRSFLIAFPGKKNGLKPIGITYAGASSSVGRNVLLCSILWKPAFSSRPEAALSGSPPAWEAS